MPTTVGDYCKNGMKYDHMTSEDLPCKPLNFLKFGTRLNETNSEINNKNNNEMNNEEGNEVKNKKSTMKI